MLKDAVKKIVLRLFPELSERTHLPQLARIVEVGSNTGKSTELDPQHCVDLQLLNDDFSDRLEQPVIKAVPVSLPGAGDDRGFSLLPKKGTVVELAFFNGNPALPFVRSVLPYNLKLPEASANNQVWQQNEDVSIKLENDRAEILAPMTKVQGNLEVKNGATGVVATIGGQVLTIRKGIVINIV